MSSHTVAVAYLACSVAIHVLPAKEDTAQTIPHPLPPSPPGKLAHPGELKDTACYPMT